MLIVEFGIDIDPADDGFYNIHIAVKPVSSNEGFALQGTPYRLAWCVIRTSEPVFREVRREFFL